VVVVPGDGSALARREPYRRLRASPRSATDSVDTVVLYSSHNWRSEVMALAPLSRGTLKKTVATIADPMAAASCCTEPKEPLALPAS
jgi:hypothetical protein